MIRDKSSCGKNVREIAAFYGTRAESPPKLDLRGDSVWFDFHIGSSNKVLLLGRPIVSRLKSCRSLFSTEPITRVRGEPLVKSVVFLPEHLSRHFGHSILKSDNASQMGKPDTVLVCD